MKYKVIDKSEAEEIAELAVCLTNEIIERTGIKHFDVDVPLAINLCQSYVSSGLYNVIAAFDENIIVGFGTLCESRSLYAEGTFGIVQEFYVMPNYRSHNIGKELIKEIVNFAKDEKWKRLELCTPPLPEFDRTVAFYKANGFEITGGHKMKFTIV
jgi:GNAT superfamily N-acetyltransferase